MSLLNIFSLGLFFIFFISYLLKLVILYKRNGIKANVLAKKGKSVEISNAERLVKVTTFIWGGLWLLFSILDSSAGQFISLGAKFSSVRYFGLIVTAVGVSIFMTAMLSMRTSWRVGIDKTTQSKLVSSGIYRYSRNPAFVGFDTMFIGFLLMYPNLLTLAVAILNIAAIHKLILQEEKHLEVFFGQEYLKYKNNTARYIIFK